MGRRSTAMAAVLAGMLAAPESAGQAPPGDGGIADGADGGILDEAPPETTPVDGRDLAQEAEALEMAGFRNLAVVHVTSDPPGAEVTLGAGNRCFAPCRLTLPPGQYRLTFQHPDHTPVETVADVATQESLRVHGVLGRRTPPEIIVPLYFVGAIFSAGGISSLILNRDEGPQSLDESAGDADSRRFHRNLGAVSVTVGVPLLILATYLLAAGRPGSVGVSAGPAGPDLGVVPVVDGEGNTAGAGLGGSF